MYLNKIKSLLLVAATGMAVIPMNAGHGSSIAAGFLGAGIGMMTGLALGSQHESHHHHYHSDKQVHHVHHACPPVGNSVSVHHTYACPPCHHPAPYHKTYIYETFEPCYPYGYPTTTVYTSRPVYDPCYHSHSSFSLGLFI